MTHWKEIEEEYDKLVDLLVETGVIDRLDASQLYTEEYIEKYIEKIKKSE